MYTNTITPKMEYKALVLVFVYVCAYRWRWGGPRGGGSDQGGPLSKSSTHAARALNQQQQASGHTRATLPPQGRNKHVLMGTHPARVPRGSGRRARLQQGCRKEVAKVDGGELITPRAAEARHVEVLTYASRERRRIQVSSIAGVQVVPHLTALVRVSASEEPEVR